MAPVPDLQSVLSGVRGWVDSVAVPAGEVSGRWKYSQHMARDWAVESSTQALSILADLGVLPTWTREQRDRVVAEIQGWQEPETGLFKDPLIHPEDKVSDHHSWEHIWLHHTGCCVGALGWLDAEPLHLLPERAFVDVREQDGAGWVLELGWDNPWAAGEHFVRVIDAYRHRVGLTGTASDEVVGAAFDQLESQVIDPATGLPDRFNKDDPPRAMAGLFKLASGYQMIGRPLPWPERAIDSVLVMQDDAGGFGQDNLCIHWDALLALLRLNEQLGGGHRFDEIAAAGMRTAEFLCRVHRRDDGGFSFHSDHCIEVHNSVRVSDPLPESDTIGTSMSLRCLRYAAVWADGQVFVPLPKKWTDPGGLDADPA